jgi:hypothetical protein
VGNGIKWPRIWSSEHGNRTLCSVVVGKLLNLLDQLRRRDSAEQNQLLVSLFLEYDDILNGKAKKSYPCSRP